MTALRATLAPKDAFTRYGIDRPPFLSTLTFKVGKSKDGRDVLLVRSSESIPEPFVTFLVEVNWARGRLMREYTVLLDPPVYTPGERASAQLRWRPDHGADRAGAPPAPRVRTTPLPAAAAPADTERAAEATPPAATAKRSGHAGRASKRGAGVRAPRQRRLSRTRAPRRQHQRPRRRGAAPRARIVSPGRHADQDRAQLACLVAGDIDQAMIAMYRANPEAFGGNINILRRGAVLRVPGADEIAALNQTEAMSEVHRQMDAWRGGGATASGGHLRLVTPGAGAAVPAGGSGESAASGEAQALKGRVKDLEAQLADAHRLLDLQCTRLSELQRKLGAPRRRPRRRRKPPPAASPRRRLPPKPSSRSSRAPPPTPLPARRREIPATPTPRRLPHPRRTEAGREKAGSPRRLRRIVDRLVDAELVGAGWR